MNRQFFVYVVFSLLAISITYSQEIRLKGNVSDSIKNPLTNVSIIAFPIIKSHKVIHTITDENGEYSLSLNVQAKYNLNISHISYKNISETFQFNQDTILNFTLISKIQVLDEVEVTQNVPIIVKKDSVIYNVESFITGRERKLRDALKKLPGIEVDRKGNVTVQGERITKVLVEGGIFFTGNSKLAVNNIPADVVSKIEVIDNYNSIAFLSQIDDTGDKVLNVILKPDKKNFLFGDVELGTGIEKRYSFHPTLFKYSKKNSYNFIGDLNNLGIKSFTTEDYINFQGGYENLLLDESTIRNNPLNNEISQFLSNDKLVSEISKFIAADVSKSFSKKTKIDAFFIGADNTSEALLKNIIQYNEVQSPDIETRKQSIGIKDLFGLGKIALKTDFTLNEVLQTDIYYKISQSKKIDNLVSISSQKNYDLNETKELGVLYLEPRFKYSKKYSSKHTATVDLNWKIFQNESLANWNSPEIFSDTIIPFVQDEEYVLNQQKTFESNNFKLSVKDYWFLNDRNHVYFSSSYNKISDFLSTSTKQLLSNGENRNFEANGFGNNIEYFFSDFTFGVEYKFLFNKLTTKIGIFPHIYSWKNIQDQKKINFEKRILLPEVNIKYDFNNSESLKLKYNQKLNFPGISDLADNKIVSGFNSIAIGDRTLQNDSGHYFSLNYKKFSFIRGISLFSNLSYRYLNSEIKNSITLFGIQQTNIPFLFFQPVKNLNGIFSFSKDINKYRLTFRANGNYKESFQIVNNKQSLNLSKSVYSEIKAKSKYSTAFNFDISYSYAPSIFKINQGNFRSVENIYSIGLYSEIGSFQVSTNYSKTFFKNVNFDTLSNFDIGSASILYQKEDSRWIFQINAENLFNTQFRREVELNNFLILDKRTFVQPRIILFKVGYKF